MRTVSRREWPKWMVKRLSDRKNIEVKEHNERYYLYTYSNVWNKKKQKPYRITRYEGVLNEIEEEKNRVLEKGNVSLLYDMLRKDVLSQLQKHFPDAVEISYRSFDE